ncbi:MAG TPA: hypothetical protein VIJ18_06830 [Microbacteriaceae bacterium]
MTAEYVAPLYRINVGGKNLISMHSLAECFREERTTTRLLELRDKN